MKFDVLSTALWIGRISADYFAASPRKAEALFRTCPSISALMRTDHSGRLNKS